MEFHYEKNSPRGFFPTLNAHVLPSLLRLSASPPEILSLYNLLTSSYSAAAPTQVQPAESVFVFRYAHSGRFFQSHYRRNLLWSSLFATTFFQPVSVSFHHKFSGQVFESAPYWSEEYSPHFSFPQVYNDNIEPIFRCWTDAVFLLEHFLTCTVIDFFFQKRSVFFSVLYG